MRLGRGAAFVLPTVLAILAAPLPAAAVTYALSPTRIIVNGDALEVDGRLELGGPRPRLTGKIKGARLDLRPWQQTGRKADTPPTSGGSEEGADRARLFSPDPLPLELLRNYELGLDLALERVVLEGAELENLRARAALDGGRLRLDPLQAGLGAGQIDGEVLVDAAGATPAVTLDLQGSDLQSAELLALAGQPPVLQAPAELRVGLHGEGASPAALAGSLSGQVTALLEQGQLDTGPLAAARDEARMLLEALQRGRVGRSSRLNCAAFDLTADRGVVTPQLAVLDTELATLAIEGSVDLGRERLDLKVLPRTKVARFDVAAPFSVGGTLAEPDIGIDRAGAARQLAGLLGALAAPPEVRRAFEGLEGDKGCLSLEADTAPAEQARPPEIEVPRNLDDLLDRGVRGLFGR
jgi:AsmA family protein